MDGNQEALESRWLVLVQQDKLGEHFTREEEIAELDISKQHKISKNVTRQMTTAIWRISARFNIPLSPEPAEKQANEAGHLTSMEVSI